MSVLTAELSGSMRWLTTGPASRPRGIWWGALRGAHERTNAARCSCSASLGVPVEGRIPMKLEG